MRVGKLSYASPVFPVAAGGTSTGLLKGPVTEFANLPIPIIDYAGQFWLVENGSGGQSEDESYKYPAGIYTPKSDGSVWQLTPLNVQVSEDSYTFLNITDWAAFLSYAFDISIGDRLIYNNIIYENQTGTIGTTPNTDTTNWKYVKLYGRSLQFDTTFPVPSHSPGQMYYDFATKSHVADTGYADVRVNLGRELMREVYNNTASPIANGTPVSATGEVIGDVLTVYPASSLDVFSILGFIGVTTMTIPVGEKGLVTNFGLVNDVNTGTLSVGFIYVGTAGDYTQEKPNFPKERMIVGSVIKTGVTDGILSIGAQTIPRMAASKSYSFTSQGVGAGLYYKGGFYDWSSTSITLNQGSLTQIYGVVGKAYAGHVGIVPSGPGVVDTGQVGLRVTGIEDSETGVQVAGQTGVITEDITTLTVDVLAETLEKFSGQITLELYVVSGAPVNYSLTFNYGYSKYEDMGNSDLTVTGVECVWQGKATDAGFDIALIHHKATGWTYAASGFLPGNGDIARKSVDQALAGSVVNNLDGAWKHINLNQFIEGSVNEGALFEIVTTQNNTIQTMDIHITAVSEEL
jgi:hypothetical protein